MLDTPLPESVNAAILDAFRTFVRSASAAHLKLPCARLLLPKTCPTLRLPDNRTRFSTCAARIDLIEACHRCFASLWTDRAISYRAARGFDHFEVALSIGVQPMVRSDQACSGVMFSLDTESGFRDVVVINGAWGLGEAIVQGMATPDEWVVFKPTLKTGARPIVSRRLGGKEVKMVYGLDGRGTRTREVVEAQRSRFCLERL